MMGGRQVSIGNGGCWMSGGDQWVGESLWLVGERG